jgi:type II secretion system protein J
MRRERHSCFHCRGAGFLPPGSCTIHGRSKPAPLQQSSRREGAFTLLELLIATAVGAVVLLVIQTTYFGALRLHNTTHDRIEQDLTMQRALAIVRRDFAGLVLPGGTLSGQFQTDNFSSVGSETHGERIGPDMFTSSGRIDGYNPFSEVQRVAFYLAAATSAEGGNSNSNAKNLVRVVTRNLLPVQEADTGEDQLLLEGVLSATISFFDGTAWTDTWDSEVTKTLPRALKLSVVMAPHNGSQSGASPIELIVPVLVRTTTSEREDEEAAAP